jgi:hypothetical protein
MTEKWLQMIMDRYAEYVLPSTEKPRLMTQTEFSELVRELNHAELLGPTLQRWNLLKESRRAPSFVNVQRNLQVSFP